MKAKDLCKMILENTLKLQDTDFGQDELCDYGQNVALYVSAMLDLDALNGEHYENLNSRLEDAYGKYPTNYMEVAVNIVMTYLDEIDYFNEVL
jgi:hypothetical protein